MIALQDSPVRSSDLAVGDYVALKKGDDRALVVRTFKRRNSRWATVRWLNGKNQGKTQDSRYDQFRLIMRPTVGGAVVFQGRKGKLVRVFEENGDVEVEFTDGETVLTSLTAIEDLDESFEQPTAIELQSDFLSGLEPEQAAEANLLDQEFRAIGRKTLEQMYRMGQINSRMKQLLPKGRYGKWVQSIGNDSTLGAWSNVARRFELEELENFVPSAARILAAPTLPEAAREEAIELAQSGTVVDLKTAQEIRDRHQKFEELVGRYREIGYEFGRSTIPKRPFVANAPGIQQLFRGLDEAEENIELMRDRLTAKREAAKPTCLDCQHRQVIDVQGGWQCGAKSEDSHTYPSEQDIARESGCRLFNRQVFGRLTPDFRPESEAETSQVKNLDDNGNAVEVLPVHTEAIDPSNSVEPTEPTRLQRIENDFYPTRDATALTRRLKEVVNIRGQVFCPTAGDGAIANEFYGSITNDLHPYEGFECDYQIDATLPELWEVVDADGGFDWAVENIPFSLAPKILPLALEHARVGVAFLLRLSYLEPCGDRATWFQEHADQMVAQIVFNPRPKFRSDTSGTDSFTVIWLVWRKDWSWEDRGIVCPFQFVSGWRGDA